MNERPSVSGGSSRQTVGRVLSFLVRAISVLAAGTLIGVGLYYGVPYVYRDLALPVRENTTRIAVLEERVGQQHQRLSENHRALQDRVTDLEIRASRLGDEIDVQTRQQQSLEELIEQLDAGLTGVQQTLESQGQAIAQTEAASERRAIRLDERIDAVDNRLEQQIGDTESHIEGLGIHLEALTGQLALVQVAESLLKVQVLLLEDNVGLARDTLDLAGSRLEQSQTLLSAQADDLEIIGERMLALDALIAERSFRARPSLESLWADVMDLASSLPADPASTEAPEPLPPTPTP